MTIPFTEEEIRDIFLWDVVNWSKALPLWCQALERTGGKALTLAEGKGAFSLIPLKYGYTVTSTDLEGVSQYAKSVYARYGYPQLQYENADILSLPYPDNSFDLIMFKSVLAILRTRENQIRAFDETYRVLKPGGKLLFSENVAGTAVHMYLRKNFVAWGHYCLYPTREDLIQFTKKFSSYQKVSCGILGTLGRSEGQRRLLGNVDNMLEKVLPERTHYIVHGVAVK